MIAFPHAAERFQGFLWIRLVDDPVRRRLRDQRTGPVFEGFVQGRLDGRRAVLLEEFPIDRVAERPFDGLVDFGSGGLCGLAGFTGFTGFTGLIFGALAGFVGLFAVAGFREHTRRQQFVHNAI